MDRWPHLGHIISYDLDDGVDILQRRNAMAGQSNNVLNYLGKLDSIAFIWQRALHSFIESVCGAWRRGGRRI